MLGLIGEISSLLKNQRFLGPKKCKAFLRVSRFCSTLCGATTIESGIMKVIGVTGGKGGTGKSTVACALAVELGRRGRTVLLCDMDADCPNDHLLLGIERKRRCMVYQRIAKWDFDKCDNCGKCALVCRNNAIVCVGGNAPMFMAKQCNGCGACVIECPRKAISWDKKVVGAVYNGRGFGVDLLSCELEINEPVSEIVVAKACDIVSEDKGKYDYVIVDTAAGTHCDVIAALGVCDAALCITEPTPLGAHDLELICRLLSRMDVGFEVVVNRYEKGRDEIADKVVSMYGKDVFAKVPYSKKIMMDYSNGVPVKHKSIDKIADWMEGSL